jgi:hypothetical protein
MKKEELETLKATFPWSYSPYMLKGTYMLKIVDKHGNEVDLLQLVKFVCYVSQLMAKKDE